MQLQCNVIFMFLREPILVIFCVIIFCMNRFSEVLFFAFTYFIRKRRKEQKKILRTGMEDKL